MAITFYFGSGSPPSWRVWFSLEHKGLAYTERLVSFQKGEHKAPEYLAINPRGKVPSIVDDGFALYESVAIVEYLDQKYPDRPLIPREVKAAAVCRRTIQEIDHYLAEPNRNLVRQTLFKPDGDGDKAIIEAARTDLARELGRLETQLTSEFLAGPLSAADYTLYPYLALSRRIGQKQPQNSIESLVGPKVLAWTKRIEALPYFDRTYPPHWRA
jgi:glutathione S-transferase